MQLEGGEMLGIQLVAFRLWSYICLSGGVVKLLEVYMLAVCFTSSVDHKTRVRISKIRCL
jgi:hypothetical protein